MRKSLGLLLILALLFSGCDSAESEEISELEVWVTSETDAEAYEKLAEQWNQDISEPKIQLNIKVYPMQRISGKMTRLLSNGSRFSSEEAPDLVEIDSAFFQEHITECKAGFYPLQNMLDSNQADGEILQGTEFFSSNENCFALPYCYQELVLCYRTDLEETLPGFVQNAYSFEKLASMGTRYEALTGRGLVSVDYLGSETFLALYMQALESCEDPQTAYEQSVAMLKRLKHSGASEYLSSGNAYGDAFQQLMVEGEIACVVTTEANLLRFAQKFPEGAKSYGVLSLPSFQGENCTVTVPFSGMAVYTAGEDPILARDFLEYCRFSEESEKYPLFGTDKERQDAKVLLSGYASVFEEDTYLSVSETISIPMLAEYIFQYSQDVLGGEEAEN